MRVLLSLAFLFTASFANAWAVDCGGKSYHYNNGALMVSSSGSVYFQSGALLLSSSGSAYFSSGALFKSSSDSLYYSSGALLKSSSGSHYYENGALARSSSGSIYRRDGSSTNIPLDIPVTLGDAVSAEVHLKPNNDPDSDTTLTIDAGAGEKMKIRMTKSGISCFGGSQASEITVRGRAGTAAVQIHRGYSAEQVRQAVQRALDSL